MSKTILKRIFLGFIALYFVLFAGRAIYDLTTFKDSDIAESGNIYYGAEKTESSLRNYASEKMEYAGDGAAAGAIDQKYERIASITSKTVSYDADLGLFNTILAENKAVIQMENRRGLAGSRTAEMVIGVRPESFDTMEAALLKIGRITSSTTTKTDKTYEYRQMLAEKETLERRLNSYENLKQKGGSVTEMLQIEDKIIEVQALIQQQMIGLGEYSDENALCTINFSLYEGSEAGVPRKLWNSLKWSTATYFIILLILVLTATAAAILMAVWSYLKKTLVEKPERKSAENPENNA